MNRIAMRLLQLLVSAVLAVPFVASPQSYPSKPIRLVVPIVPGGSVDLFARRMALKLNEALGQPMVVENQPGANGTIGASLVARAVADGYTIMFATVGEVIGAVFLRRDLAYDPIKDFTPLMAAVEALGMVVVRSDAPGNTLKDFLEYARRNPGKLTYASTGNGSYYHLTGELLKHDAGVDLLHVPYKGVPAAMNDLVGGQVDLAFAAIASARPFMNRIKVLAVLEPRRYAGLANVPTVSEFVPAFEKLPTWYAYFAPTGLARPVQFRLNAEMAKALGAPDMREWLDANGFVPIGGTPEDLAALHRKGLERYGMVVKMAGIKPE